MPTPLPTFILSGIAEGNYNLQILRLNDNGIYVQYCKVLMICTTCPSPMQRRGILAYVDLLNKMEPA